MNLLTITALIHFQSKSKEFQTFWSFSMIPAHHMKSALLINSNLFLETAPSVIHSHLIIS